MRITDIEVMRQERSRRSGVFLFIGIAKDKLRLRNTLFVVLLLCKVIKTCRRRLRCLRVKRRRKRQGWGQRRYKNRVFPIDHR